MPDARATLAYEAIQQNLASQEGTLSNLRNRAASLLTAAVVVATFSSAVGLIGNDPTKSTVLAPPVALTSLATVTGVIASVLYTMWPVRNWAFGPSGKKILEYIAQGLDEDAIKMELTGILAKGAQRNRREIRRRWRSYRLGILLLGIEVAVLTLAIPFQ
jgi:hypothetical protein